MYLTRDPPRLLGNWQTAARGEREDETISSGSTAEEHRRNQTKREGIEERDPKTYLASPRALVAARTKQFFLFYFFACACVLVRLIGGRGRDARHRRRGGSKGKRPRVPRVGGSGKPRAVPVAFVAAKCPAGDVIRDSLTGGPIY